LRSWAEIETNVRDGIRAVAPRHRRLLADGARFICSVDLDSARRTAEPQAPRWDYILGESAEAVGMEVHPAKASEVDAVIAKKLWAEQLLRDYCRLTVNRWCWVRPPRSRLQFTPLSPGARRLAKHGIHFPTARL
jgi:hypothetical protein